MKGYRIGSQWLWRRADGNFTQVTIVKSKTHKLKVRANISGLTWETKDIHRLFDTSYPA